MYWLVLKSSDSGVSHLGVVGFWACLFSEIGRLGDKVWQYRWDCYKEVLPVTGTQWRRLSSSLDPTDYE
jgi:hypothetical protein